MLEQSELRQIVSSEIVDSVMKATRTLAISGNYRVPTLSLVASESNVSEKIISEVFKNATALRDETFENSWARVTNYVVEVHAAEKETDPLVRLLRFIRLTLQTYNLSVDMRQHLTFAFGTYQYLWNNRGVSDHMADAERSFIFDHFLPLVKGVMITHMHERHNDGFHMTYFLLGSMGRLIQSWNYADRGSDVQTMDTNQYIDALKMVVFNRPESRSLQ
jgi:hypothetical protein